MPDRGRRGRGNRRRQRRREDEPRRIGAHRVDHRLRTRDVTAEVAERLRQRSLDHVDLVEQPFALRDPAAARPVHADRVDLVEIRHRIVLARQRRDLGHRRDVAVHRVDAFERDQLRPLQRQRLQQLLEMPEIVVAEDLLGRPRRLDAVDHRGVVELVRQHHAVRQQPRDRRDPREVRHIARGKDECGFFAVQVGQFVLEFDERPVGAGNVACATGADAGPVRRLAHRSHHVRVLAHAEVVVRAPDRDVAQAPVILAQDRDRKLAGLALEIGEHAIPPLRMQRIEGVVENIVVSAHRPELPKAFRPLALLSVATDRSFDDAGSGP